MLVQFDQLDPQSRIWIYQSNKKFSEEEKNFIIKNTEAFLIEWTAHGKSLEAGVHIAFNQFIILGVNENANEASGCSIDKSVNFMRELGAALNADLLERSKVAIKKDNEIELVEFSEIKNLVASNHIPEESEIFNNAIVAKADLDTRWLLPAKNSWIKRFFNG